jgi:hypothetical protein
MEPRKHDSLAGGLPFKIQAVALVSVLWLSLASGDAATAQELPDYDSYDQSSYAELVHRFRPYLKFSKQSFPQLGDEENRRPSSWQFIYSRSDLKDKDSGTLLLAASQIDQDPKLVLDHADVRKQTSPNITLNLCNGCNEDEFRSGEPWENVAELGHGIYAHVEPIDQSRLVNIEYWFVFPFNDPGYGGDPGQGGVHYIDFATVILVYDPKLNQLVRVTFSEHGMVLIAFDFTKAELPERVILPTGEPIAGASETYLGDAEGRVFANKYVIKEFGTYLERNANFLYPCPTSTSDTNGFEKYLYLLPDPDTGRPEHPVVFLESGSHEPWPNPSGYFSAAPNHHGDGISFLPKRVPLLRSPDDDPFVFYGGVFAGGDDNNKGNQALMAHRAWLDSLWNGEKHDLDPYLTHTDGNPWDCPVPGAVHYTYASTIWPPIAPQIAGCNWTADFSDETDPQECAPGFWATAMGCAGSNCDNVSLQCCPAEALALPQSSDPGDRNWIGPFSDGDTPISCPAESYVKGARCTHDYCDNMYLLCVKSPNPRRSCAPIHEFSDLVTTNGFFTGSVGQCPGAQVIGGAQCSGSYCANIALTCCDAASDTDGDGVSDPVDNCPQIANADQADADGDGMGDVCDACPSDPLNDADHDGLCADQEALLGTNPNNPDTDGDGLTDGYEVNTAHTDPLKADTDHDELSDGDEVNVYHTDPLNADTDADGLSDGVEVNTYHTNPLDPDTDHDKLPDGIEVTYGTDPLNPDSDGDGIPDGQDSQFIRNALYQLPTSAFRARGARQAMTVRLAAIERRIAKGDPQHAIRLLDNLRRRLDGCGTSPGRNDWIVLCRSQISFRGLIDLLIANLTA